jgi:hypothetical protein
MARMTIFNFTYEPNPGKKRLTIAETMNDSDCDDHTSLQLLFFNISQGVRKA